MSHEAAVGVRLADPHEQEVEARLDTVRLGIGITVLVTVGALAYALATWERPNRDLILAMFVAALSSAVIVGLLPTERIIRSRWRETFFAGWSIVDIAMIATITAADGGTGSPYTLLFVLPFLFGTLSYPLPVAILVCAVDVAAFIGVAVAAGGGLAYSGFAAFGLACAAILSIWEARSQGRRRLALEHTAQALLTSEGTSRLQAHQQEAVAQFGQMALAGADIEELASEATRVLQRVLNVDIAGVLKLLSDEETLLISAGVGLPAEAIGKAKVPAGFGSQAGYTLVTGSPVIVTDWATERRFSQSEILAELGIVSGATVMIRANGEPYGVLGLQSARRRNFTNQDVSFMQAIANILANAIERHFAEERTRHEALHDPLTGLPNRNLFLDRLGHALGQAQRHGTSVAVLFLDLDQFKLVNDSLGHAAGDELLAAVAPRLEHALRPGDTVARFGGDEFAVLGEEISSERDATRLAERIAEGLARPFILHRREHFVSASIGISIGSGGEAEALIRDADAALYRAKERGRGGYEIFDSLMRARVIEHVQTENDLRRALERRELELHYQPVVALGDGSVAAMEALLRWRHPLWGLIKPEVFVPVSEESHLIVPIGRWAIETACRHAAEWQSIDPDGPPVGVAVNLSAPQLADPELPGLVSSAVSRSGIDPATLSLELTESVLLEETESPEQTVETLKAAGIRLALDDFGVGFSSLGYLRRLPLDAIKLDRSFIENVVEESADAAIVGAVVEMARALGLEVVAEGVETAEQLHAVRSLGCGHAQGFYFTEPVPSTEVVGLIRRPPWRVPAGARV